MFYTRCYVALIIMRRAEEIYQDARNEVLESGNQSSNSMAIIGIEKAQKEMFYFIYSEAEREENKNLSLIDFFDKMDSELTFS
jgi:hypothetical protein